MRNIGRKNLFNLFMSLIPFKWPDP